MEKDVEIAELKGHVARLKRTADEMGGVLLQLSGLRLRLLDDESLRSSPANDSKTSSLGSDGDGADASGTSAEAGAAAFGGDAIVAAPSGAIRWEGAVPAKGVGSERHSHDIQDQSIIHASIVDASIDIPRREVVHGCRYYESREATSTGLLQWCLRVPPEPPSDHISSLYFRVGVIADGSPPDTWLEVIDSTEFDTPPWGDYIVVVADLARGRVVFGMGPTRESVTEVDCYEVPRDQAVKLACFTQHLLVQNPDAAGADAVFELRQA